MRLRQAIKVIRASRIHRRHYRGHTLLRADLRVLKTPSEHSKTFSRIPHWVGRPDRPGMWLETGWKVRVRHRMRAEP